MKKLIIIPLFLLFALNSNAQDKHPIIGVWQLTTVEVDGETKEGFEAVWVFEDGGILKAARSVTNEAIPVGKWKCDKDRKMLIMESTMDKDFNGEAKVLKLKKNQLSYKKDGAILNFVMTEMVKPDTTPIPKLEFSYDDFYKGDEYAYPEEDEKLPWNLEQIYASLKNVKEMVYNVSHFKPNKGNVDSWINSYKVKFIDDEGLSIREYSYFQKDFIDMTENVFPLNEETKGQKEFYPKSKPELFRVIGEEDCKTDLGTFKCTIVEAIGDFDAKVKYWMINDKPGTYAKIIIAVEEGNPFDYTNVYKLKEIK